jgi:hypothetical protein
MDDRNSTVKVLAMIVAAIALTIFLPGVGITLVMMFLVYKFRRHIWLLPMAGLIFSLVMYSGLYLGAFLGFFTR